MKFDTDDIMKTLRKIEKSINPAVIEEKLAEIKNIVMDVLSTDHAEQSEPTVSHTWNNDLTIKNYIHEVDAITRRIGDLNVVAPDVLQVLTARDINLMTDLELSGYIAGINRAIETMQGFIHLHKRIVSYIEWELARKNID